MIIRERGGGLACLRLRFRLGADHPSAAARGWTRGVSEASPRGSGTLRPRPRSRYVASRIADFSPRHPPPAALPGGKPPAAPGPRRLLLQRLGLCSLRFQFRKQEVHGAVTSNGGNRGVFSFSAFEDYYGFIDFFILSVVLVLKQFTSTKYYYFFNLLRLNVKPES